MIVGQMGDQCECLVGEPWDSAFRFIAALDTDAATGRYPLDGDAMYAVIEAYETRAVESALPEAHRRYIDIQVVLAGREQIAWWPIVGLDAADPYDAERDIVFYGRPESGASMAGLIPGRFAVFFPGDAHMPGLRVGTAPELVRKAVIKIRAA